MISYKRSNALQPEKESVVHVNLMPLLVFALGFVVIRNLLGQSNLSQSNKARR